jgi:hypothetical protein
MSRHRFEWDRFTEALNGIGEMVAAQHEGSREFIRIHASTPVRPSGHSGVSEVDPAVKVAQRCAEGQES